MDFGFSSFDRGKERETDAYFQEENLTVDADPKSKCNSTKSVKKIIYWTSNAKPIALMLQFI